MKFKREAPFLLSRIQQIADRVMNEKLVNLTENKINAGQGRILFALWNEDHISIQALSQRTSLWKSTLTNMLDRLESKRFLKRVRSAFDRREILIELTGEDKKFQKSFQQATNELTHLMYKGISEKEADQFEKILRTVLKNIENAEQGNDHD